MKEHICAKDSVSPDCPIWEEFEALKKELERYEATPPTWSELSNLQDGNEALQTERDALVEVVKDFVHFLGIEGDASMEGCIQTMRKAAALKEVGEPTTSNPTIEP